LNDIIEGKKPQTKLIEYQTNKQA